MNCQETDPLLEGYFDGEIDLVRSLEIERHLESCSPCAGRLKAQQALRTSLRSALPYYRAPSELSRWVREQGEREPHSRQKPSWNWNWRVWAPAVAALAFIGVTLGQPRVSREVAERRLAQDVASAHVRSLMAAHLTDVTSTDQHTVKPWFNGKLDFSPLVRDLAEYSFPLVGGRLDYLSERPVAALVYKRNQHLINLFIWPAPHEADRALRALTQRGYNVLHWARGGMTYWAVSDLNKPELEQFVHIIETQALLSS